MSLCTKFNVSSQSWRTNINIFCYRTLKNRTLMGIKKKFCLKKPTRYSYPFIQPSLEAGNSGYFPRWRRTHQSFPDPLNFSKWWSSQFFPPWGSLWMSKSLPTSAWWSLIPLGCPTPPSWGKPLICELIHRTLLQGIKYRSAVDVIIFIQRAASIAWTEWNWHKYVFSSLHILLYFTFSS